MAIQYSVVGGIVKLNPEKPKSMYYAHMRQNGRVELMDVAQNISNQCSLHRADVLATLEVMTDTVLHYLSLGHSVSLGRLGSFRLSIKSKASDELKSFGHQNIKQLRMRFFASPEIKALLKRVPAHSLSQPEEAAVPEGTPPSGDGGSSTPSAPPAGGASGSGSSASGEE